MKRTDSTTPSATTVRPGVRAALAALLALTLGLGAAHAAAPGRDLVLPFSQMGQREAVMLKRGHSRHQFPFALRADEVASSAILKLDLAQSPMLAGRAGALEVRLNGELVSRLDPSTTAGTASRSGSHTVPIDPRLLIDQNELTVQFAEPLDCSAAESAGLWAQIAPSSTLNLVMSPLPLANDLSLLPSPFFDPRDPRRNELTLVLSPRASDATLQAAGNVASWFGALSAYRGVRIQARDRLPTGHAIVLATTEDAPRHGAAAHRRRFGDPGHPPGPAAPQGALPARPRRRRAAPRGRRAGAWPVARPWQQRTDRPPDRSGPTAGLGGTQLDPHPPPGPPGRAGVHGRAGLARCPAAGGERADAPATRPLRLARTQGADRSAGALRGTAGESAAALRVRFNGEERLNESLEPGAAGRWVDKLQRSLRGERDEALTQSARRTLRLPVAALGTQSYARLDMTLQPGVIDEASECERESRADAALDRPRSVVDGASTIDFSDAPHFLPMPDLAAFANTTHPYTRLADLAETAVVLPDQPSREDLDTFLTLMGRAGEATGLAARLVRVVRARHVGQVTDHDLIVIGSAGNQRLFADWAGAMPFRDLAAAQTSRAATPASARSAAGLSPADWTLPDSLRWIRSLWEDNERMPQETLSFRGTDPQAALVGFESPLASNRSVVGLMATTPAALSFITEALLDSTRLAQIQGHVALFDESGRITPYSAEPTYASGNLSWVSWIRWKLSDRPVLMWAVLMLGILVLSAVIYLLLQRHAMRRHAGAST